MRGMFERRTPPPRSATAPPPAAPAESPHTDGGLELVPFWAKITGQAAGTNRYAWTQIDDGDTAAFDTGLSEQFAAQGTEDEEGAPAYEVNGREDIPVDTRVLLWPAGDLGYYVFALGPPAPDDPTWDQKAVPANTGVVHGEVLESVTLGPAGMYWIFFQVTGQVTVTVTGTNWQMAVYLRRPGFPTRASPGLMVNYVHSPSTATITQTRSAYCGYLVTTGSDNEVYDLQTEFSGIAVPSAMNILDDSGNTGNSFIGWIRMDAPNGPSGPPGPTGATGATGPAGADGADGANTPDDSNAVLGMNLYMP